MARLLKKQLNKSTKQKHSRGILFSSFMNLSFSLEKASSFSPVPGPAMLVVLEPAVAEEAVVDSGAASASLRLSLIAAMLGSQADAGKAAEEKDETEQDGIFFFSLSLLPWKMRVRAEAARSPRQMTEVTQTRVSSCRLSLSKHQLGSGMDPEQSCSLTA